MRTALVLALCTARAAAQPADWAPQRDGFDPHVIARYEQLLAADPFDARTLAKLARLFTGRHTAAELERQLGEDRPAGLIARAQLHRSRNDPAGALALYERAIELAPEDPLAAKTWLAIAQLHRDRGEPGEARPADLAGPGRARATRPHGRAVLARRLGRERRRAAARGMEPTRARRTLVRGGCPARAR